VARVAITDTSPESVAALVAGITPFLGQTSANGVAPGGPAHTENKAGVRAWIAQHPRFTIGELQGALGLAKQQSSNILYQLNRDGEITRVSKGTYEVPGATAPAPGRRGPLLDQARAWIATGPATFTTEALQAALGWDSKRSRNVVYQLGKRGEITRVSQGTYKPTKTLRPL
jgi:predicted transcriptional regulator of viral defense system